MMVCALPVYGHPEWFSKRVPNKLYNKYIIKMTHAPKTTKYFSLKGGVFEKSVVHFLKLQRKQRRILVDLHDVLLQIVPSELPAVTSSSIFER